MSTLLNQFNLTFLITRRIIVENHIFQVIKMEAIQKLMIIMFKFRLKTTNITMFLKNGMTKALKSILRSALAKVMD